jgi:hypothetical protein
MAFSFPSLQLGESLSVSRQPFDPSGPTNQCRAGRARGTTQRAASSILKEIKEIQEEIQEEIQKVTR